MAYLIGLIIIVVAGAGVYLAYRQILRKAKAVERSLKMVPLLIHLPPRSADTEVGNHSVSEIMKDKISQAEVLYDLLAGTASSGFKSKFYGQRHIALEIVSHKGVIHFYAAVPVAMVPVVTNAILTAYPNARVEEQEDYNLFNPQGKLLGAAGGELVLKADEAYPIATADKLERDPMEAIMNALSNLGPDEGAGVQIMLRPAAKGWITHAKNIVAKKRRRGSHVSMQITGKDLLRAAMKGNDPAKETQLATLTTLEQQVLDAIEAKTTKPGFEVLIRLVVSTNAAEKAQATLRNLAAAFSLFESPGLNGFKFLPAGDVSGLTTAYIMRYFPPELKNTVLNSAEMAMIYHIPDAQFSANSEVERQLSKQVDGPINLPQIGLLLGYNFFRDTKKEVRLDVQDRRRHTYIVGQTGTGKSTLLENLAVQDMLAGNGFAFIDPHGDTAEKLMSLVPKNRAEDVIYFNPADMDYPLGLNLFEFSDDAQKDFLIQESIGMLYKLYDPGHTGIIGPRYEHWFRNAALTLMADPAGATFIEIPKVFTDAEYLKSKFRYLKDPTVIDFWTKEMAQTSDYHKSEMLGWFVSKFGAFMNNEMMRNILGQTKSAFNLQQVMDQKKILIVNLSKGRIGELNSQLLGMIFVIKMQAAAMARATVAEDSRQDFCLYVDEFQNFSTDSFATILSEARKYRLNLIVANQFIGQLSDQIRDAVFGNVGTVVSYRTGPEDADFLVKQFSPIFDEHDLVNLPNYNAAVRLMIAGLPSQPFSMTAMPPLGKVNAEMGAAVKQLSAAKFGIARGAVEAQIFARLSTTPKRPAAPSPVPDPAPVNPVTPPATATPVSVAGPQLPPAPPVRSEPPAPAVQPAAQPVQAAATPPAQPAAPGVDGSALDALKQSLRAASEEALEHLQLTPANQTAPARASSPTTSLSPASAGPAQSGLGAVIMPQASADPRLDTYLVPESAPQTQTLRVTSPASPTHETVTEPMPDDPGSLIGKAKLEGASSVQTKPLAAASQPPAPAKVVVAEKASEATAGSGKVTGEVTVDPDGTVHMA